MLSEKASGAFEVENWMAGVSKVDYLNIQNVVPPKQLLKISFFFPTPNCITIIPSTPTHLNH